MNDYLYQINKRRINPVIEEILKQAKEFKTPIIREDAINFIIHLIKIGGYKNILEIGTAIGYSSIMMATFTTASVLSIERDESSYKKSVLNVKKARLESKITLILADANDYKLSEDYHCDLLFIDASKSSYINFFNKYEKYLNKNGIVISDNLLFHGYLEHPEIIKSRNKKQLVRKINKFNEFIINNPNYDTYIYDIGDGLSISIRK